MLCPLCNHRKAKRACPALGKRSAPCAAAPNGSSKLTALQTAGILRSARTHPPAIVQRQQEVDRALILPLLQGLSERQARLFLMLSAVTARHQGEMFQKLVDEDIAQAAGALAGTLETAGRGIVYEHRPASLPAARLMTDLKAMVDEVAKNAGAALDRDAAIALRRTRARGEDDGDSSTGQEPVSTTAAAGACAGSRSRRLQNRVAAPDCPGTFPDPPVTAIMTGSLGRN